MTSIQILSRCRVQKAPLLAAMSLVDWSWALGLLGCALLENCLVALGTSDAKHALASGNGAAPPRSGSTDPLNGFSCRDAGVLASVVVGGVRLGSARIDVWTFVLCAILAALWGQRQPP